MKLGMFFGEKYIILINKTRKMFWKPFSVTQFVLIKYIVVRQIYFNSAKIKALLSIKLFSCNYEFLSIGWCICTVQGTL